MPTQFQLIAQLGESPAISWAILILFSALTGFWYVFKLHPEWRNTRRNIAVDIFERLCAAYEDYRRHHSPGVGLDLARARLEAAAEEYCKAPVHHRLADIAFRADSPTQALNEIRKLPKAITYEEGEFRRTVKPYSFPDQKDEHLWMNWSMALYVAFSLYFGGTLIMIFSDIISWPLAIPLLSLSYFPGLGVYETLKKSRKLGNLYRVRKLIESQGERTYNNP